MEEQPQQMNPEELLEHAFLGAMQNKIGVLETNLMRRDLQLLQAEQKQATHEAVVASLRHQQKELSAAHDTLRREYQALHMEKEALQKAVDKCGAVKRSTRKSGTQRKR